MWDLNGSHSNIQEEDEQLENSKYILTQKSVLSPAIAAIITHLCDAQLYSPPPVSID